MGFWDQLQPHPNQALFTGGQAPPTGGINGGMTVDPSQLQPSDIIYGNEPKFDPIGSSGSMQTPKSQQPMNVIGGGGSIGATALPMSGNATAYDQFNGSLGLGSPSGPSGMVQSAGFGTLLSDYLHHLVTPDGRIVQVPHGKLQEALSKGGTYLRSVGGGMF